MFVVGHVIVVIAELVFLGATIWWLFGSDMATSGDTGESIDG